MVFVHKGVSRRGLALIDRVEDETDNQNRKTQWFYKHLTYIYIYIINNLS